MDNKPGLFQQSLTAVGNAATEVGKGILDQSGAGRLWETGKNLYGRLKGTKPAGRVSLTPPEFNIKFEGDKDFRVMIRVPAAYRANPELAYESDLDKVGGIIFPYTPTITQDYTANYATLNPTHSNYGLHFYKHSTPGAISVSGKFTVQNLSEAYNWLRTVHILRSITKMRFGADENAGAPPPVCRFHGYGEQQYKNVPVVLTSFRVELPDSVDYYATNMQDLSNRTVGIMPTGTMVPTVSQITITLLPMYSRQELLGISQVTDYVGNGGKLGNLRRRGYL